MSRFRVLSSTLIIFSFIFFVFIINSYFDKKREQKYFYSLMNKKIDFMYNTVVKNSFEEQLFKRANAILSFENEKKIKALLSEDKSTLIDLFSKDYLFLIDNLKGFKSIELYNKDGSSLISFSKTSKIKHESISKSIYNKGFFQLEDKQLVYSYIKEIYQDLERIAYIKLSINPVLLQNRISNLFDTRGYVFIKNDPKKETLTMSNYTFCNYCNFDNKSLEESIMKLDLRNTDIEFDFQDKTYLIINKTIFDQSMKKIGEFIFLSDISNYKKRFLLFMINSIFLFIISSLAIYIVLNGYFKKIFKKLNRARFLLDNTNDAVYVIRLSDGVVLDVNKKACETLAYSRIEFLNKKILDFKKPFNNGISLTWDEEVRKLKEEKYLSIRSIYISKDGKEIPVDANLSYVQSNNEEFMIAVARDITEQLAMENKINKKAYQLQRSQDVISKSVLYTTSDLQGRVTSVSKAFEKLTGYKEDELIGKNHSIFKTPDMTKEFYEQMWRILDNNEQFVGEIKNYAKNKKVYWVKLTIDPLFNKEGEKVGYSSYQENITDKKELEYLSSHDSLTGIKNRGEFKKELRVKIKSNKRYHQKFGLIMIDIDYFKSINDTYGHKIGDDVLVSIASCVKNSLREDDFFARWGGEEFVIIASFAKIEDLEGLVCKLQAAIKELDLLPVPYLTASYGLTLFTEDDDEESIQKRADDALYKAKRNGRNRYEIKL
ncbi:sensor domain-containing diguanylate cyclase [Poseidonibacter lekithochrous]|uniref:sensor domain-containing diguanylate cyclase n=2 Tax=Poseidonibacter lekithochrous TaxID=1904463 RepID=UPI0008FCC61D|nr:diguanylate cyclase [Poseidonibacter lekithochrous]QKJ24582.1 PAS sensor-containing diguanylate cyclase [Poseidonibacter lekithochrous]